MERGIVSMRVGLSYDLLRLSPCSGDLYANPAGIFRKKNTPRTPTNPTKTQKQLRLDKEESVLVEVKACIQVKKGLLNKILNNVLQSKEGSVR